MHQALRIFRINYTINKFLGTFVRQWDHTRTVVRECRKGDDASQWGNRKFDTSTGPRPLTDRQQRLHT